MPGIIQVNHQTVQSHKAAISAHHPSFNVRLPNVSGGTVQVLATADVLGISFGDIAGQYAEILPNSAQDIQRIATAMAQTDADLGRSMRAMR